jgi:hypothetical protein
MNVEQLHELLYQTLEAELGGAAIYETARRCVQKDELRKDFERYHEQTTHHVDLVEGLLRAFGLHPGAETPGRKVVRQLGDSLVAAMERALKVGPPNAAELVAAECVTLAEARDQLNWGLIGEVLSRVRGEAGSALLIPTFIDPPAGHGVATARGTRGEMEQSWTRTEATDDRARSRTPLGSGDVLASGIGG